ncbi:MAG: sigW 13 [Acidobacteria bacterium]|nr:sigW 13 [Acidobacteriota bacterium]
MPAVVALLLLACGGRDSGTPRLDVRPQGAAEPPTFATPLDAGPRAVAFDPPLGAAGVDPSRTTLAVTFDRDMDPEGWAWVVENAATAPEVGESSWDPAQRTNTVQVRLQPGRDYVVWVNSPQYSYFRDRGGKPAAPVRWTFSTAAAGGGPRPPLPPLAPVAPVAAHAAPQAPRVVALAPADGAGAVDPALAELRVTFDRAMADGWSWVMESPESFPTMTGKAFLTPDGREAVLPVRLEAGRSYVVWLNSDRYQGFRGRDGAALAPVRWAFSTAAVP